MKLAVIGDTHFGIKGFNKEFYKSQIEFFNFFLNDIKDRDIDAVIQLGDFFDNRKIIDINFFQDLVDDFSVFLNKLNIPFYIFFGNHDIYYKDTLNTSPLYFFKNLMPNNFNLITTQTKIENFAMVPWLLPEENIKEGLLNANVIFGHFEFQGFEMLPGVISKTGHKVPKTDALILSGHFHTPSQNQNVIYTGTPYQLNWADTGSKRGYYIVDTKTKDFEFIENLVSKKYITIKLKKEIESEINPYDITALRYNFIRVILYEENNKNLSYLKFLSNENINFKFLDKTIQEEIQEIDMSKIKRPEQLLFEYIKDEKTQKALSELLLEAQDEIKD